MRYIMEDMKIEDFLRIEWSDPGEALIEPPRFSPVIADPSFLFPEETPSGEWELFAHSAWGIHRFSSPDGKAWRDRGIVVPNAMRPFIRRFDGIEGAQRYSLFFEAYPPLALAFTALPIRPRWKSKIALSRSADLTNWTRAKTLLEPSLAWMKDATLGSSVSNPCLIEDDKAEWRLYFSASLAWIDDCGFCEPRYLALARSESAEGPFVPDKEPIVDPANDAVPGALGAGSIKVIRMDDGYIGLQNKIYSDRDGRSRSAIFLLSSVDGVDWSTARAEPLLAPAAGWTSSHVYACDCRLREAEGHWYLYFNARDGWGIREGAERIGRVVGRA
jgi:hypothetical protein